MFMASFGHIHMSYASPLIPIRVVHTYPTYLAGETRIFHSRAYTAVKFRMKNSKMFSYNSLPRNWLTALLVLALLFLVFNNQTPIIVIQPNQSNEVPSVQKAPIQKQWECSKLLTPNSPGVCFFHSQIAAKQVCKLL